jgi:deazaflavin-dependent oxidoreductase (nitroreductase family)
MTAIRRTRATELMWRLHTLIYRISGGRIGTRLGVLPVLLLTIKGRKSGEPRTVALNYLEDAGGYVVFASHAGEDREPPWWLNLRDAGEADVQVGAQKHHVRAREAEGEERERLWTRVKREDDAYAVYETRTQRRIATVVLDRSSGDSIEVARRRAPRDGQSPSG